MISGANSDYIDFEKEVQEFIQKKYVESIQFLEKSKVASLMKLETLEKEVFLLRCSVSKGIEVKKKLIKKNGECILIVKKAIGKKKGKKN